MKTCHRRQPSQQAAKQYVKLGNAHPRSFMLKPGLRDELYRYGTARDWLACALLQGHRRTSSTHDVVASVIDDAYRGVTPGHRFDARKLDRAPSAADAIHLP